ncbi:MAG: hypothetical protein QM760_16305 [Nibricoccus sp.]
MFASDAPVQPPTVDADDHHVLDRRDRPLRFRHRHAKLREDR